MPIFIDFYSYNVIYLKSGGVFMSKKIIVAGGGHGGIAVASILSRNGFDVTVYEKNSRENMVFPHFVIFMMN